MSRLIHYKVKTNHCLPVKGEDGVSFAGPGLVTVDHNEMIGGTGPLPERGLPLVIRKLCKKHAVEESQIVVCNIIELASYSSADIT
jgi:hypothetical protein